MENSISKLESNRKAKRSFDLRRRHWQILGLVGLQSILISLYALSMGQKIVPAASQNKMEQAALAVAQDLASVNVRAKRFGSVGLCDLFPENSLANSKQIGLNSLYATLRLDAMAAKRLQSSFMYGLVEQDFLEAQKVETELASSLRRAIRMHAPEPGSGKRLAIYDKAAKIISQGQEITGQSKLVDLTIELGKLKNPIFTSSVPAAISITKDASATIINGFYRSHSPIPIVDNLNKQFYELADKPHIVNVADFVKDEPSVVSSVVKLEATFESFDKKKQQKVLTKRQVCAVVGALPCPRPNSVFMLSFPQGRLKCFNSLQNIVAFMNWRNEGKWWQSSGGPVPGSGHLAASAMFPGAMKAGEAILVAFYHWLFSLGPYLSPDQLDKMMSLEWSVDSGVSKLNRQVPEIEIVSNSALLRENKAASFALINQSQPGGLGQKILQNAFSAKPSFECFPLSALPLQISYDGHCSLPGQAVFEKQLIHDFLTDLYNSNLAGIETQSVAYTVEARMAEALKKSEIFIAVKNKELLSIDGNSTRAPGGQNRLVEKQQKRDQIKALLLAENNRIKQYIEIRQLANLVSSNAKKAINHSFELCSNMTRLAAQGLNRINNNNTEAYLLSQGTVFIPHCQPVSEKNIFDKANQKINIQAAANKENSSFNSWTSNNFQVLVSPEKNATVNGFSLSEFGRKQAQIKKNRPLFVLFNSDLLTRNSSSGLLLLDQSPFANTGIPLSELSYYAADAFRTGKEPEVKWSVLLRDLVACSEVSAGQPVSSLKQEWCNGLKVQEDRCPGLACEIQIRAPLPLLEGLPYGLMVQSPGDHEAVPLVPPAPAELL